MSPRVRCRRIRSDACRLGAIAIAVVASAVVCNIAPAQARAAAPAPAWRIASVALPTRFSEGGQFDIRVANVGGGESDGSPVRVTDTLARRPDDRWHATGRAARPEPRCAMGMHADRRGSPAGHLRISARRPRRRASAAARDRGARPARCPGAPDDAHEHGHGLRWWRRERERHLKCAGRSAGPGAVRLGVL